MLQVFLKTNINHVLIVVFFQSIFDDISDKKLCSLRVIFVIHAGMIFQKEIKLLRKGELFYDNIITG